jgi:spermidine synthase
MGALFSAACRQAGQAGVTLGHAIAVNTLAAAAAPALVGVWLLPQIGAARLWLALVFAYAALATWRMARWRTPALVGAVGLGFAAAVLLPELRFVDLGPSDRLVWFRDGVMATVSITADEHKVQRLRINNRIQEGSSASSPLETRLALLPLLTHHQPHQALFLGLGTGATAHVAAQWPELSVDVVELLPEVVEAARLFMAAAAAPHPQRPPRIMVADARRYVQATRQRYDVIVADLFHPARSGAGGLYTAEHFEAVRQRLAPGGVFCQWVALHQMELSTLDAIVAAFDEVFPDGQVLLASNSLDSPVIGLWAAADGVRPRLEQVELALGGMPPELRPRAQQARLTDAYAVLGSWLSSVRDWRSRTPDARPNRDDLPLVAHQAPWDDYAPRHTPPQRLSALLQRLEPTRHAGSPGWPALLAADAPARQGQDLADYRSARDRYLRLGLMLQGDADADAQRLLQRLEPELAALLDLSPHFGPAGDALTSLRKVATRATGATSGPALVAAGP